MEIKKVVTRAKKLSPSKRRTKSSPMQKIFDLDLNQGESSSLRSTSFGSSEKHLTKSDSLNTLKTARSDTSLVADKKESVDSPVDEIPTSSHAKKSAKKISVGRLEGRSATKKSSLKTSQKGSPTERESTDEGSKEPFREDTEGYPSDPSDTSERDAGRNSSSEIDRKDDGTPFKCKFCLKTFTTKYNLKTHTKTSKSCLQRRSEKTNTKNDPTSPRRVEDDQGEVMEFSLFLKQLSKYAGNISMGSACTYDFLKEKCDAIEDMLDEDLKVAIINVRFKFLIDLLKSQKRS